MIQGWNSLYVARLEINWIIQNSTSLINETKS